MGRASSRAQHFIMNRVIVSLGSNIEKESNMPAAVSLLSERCQLLAVSTVYETSPVGLLDQPHFWNASVLLETRFDAWSLKREVLIPVEIRLNRVRTAERNAPRTIDADITLFNDEVFDLDEGHHIPDPDLLKFPHVAVPTAELAPDMKHPETGESLRDIANRLIKQSSGEGQPSLRRLPGVTLDIYVK